MIHQVEFKSLILTIEGTYIKGSYGTRETPPEQEEFEIDKVTMLETDVTEFCEDYMEELEQLVIEKYYR